MMPQARVRLSCIFGPGSVETEEGAAHLYENDILTLKPSGSDAFPCPQACLRGGEINWIPRA